MTNDQIIARGIEAARILGDAAFMSFFNEVKSDIKEASFNTIPSQAEEREQFYFQLRGIDDVLSVMTAYAARAEDLLNARNSVDENTYDD